MARSELDRRSVAGILLAAGSSRRFGRDNKLLALLDGKPLVRHAAETLSGLGLGELICVTGPDAGKVEQLLAGLGFRFVQNTHYLEGMGGSVATGIGAVGNGLRGALVCLGDMPRLPRHLLIGLIERFLSDDERIVFPCLPDGSQRNPVLWPRRLFGELRQLHGERGAKAILEAHAAETAAVAASADAFIDIDTVEELEAQTSQSGK